MELNSTPLKATIEFDLTDFDSKLNLNRMLKADSCYMVFNDLFNHLRSKTKYEDQDIINIQELREWISDRLENEGIDLNDLR